MDDLSKSKDAEIASLENGIAQVLHSLYASRAPHLYLTGQPLKGRVGICIEGWGEG